MVWQHSYTTMPSHLNFLLHKNISYSASQSNASTGPRFSSATEPSNSTKHSSIQKGSVQCTVGASSISSLFYAVWYSGSFDAFERLISLSLPCFAIYGYFSLFKLVIEPAALLLEDQRSEASSEGHNQTTWLFIGLVYKYIISYVKKFILRKVYSGLLELKCKCKSSNCSNSTICGGHWF